MVTLHAPHTSKYYQLSQHVQQQIVAGELSPNQQLPTEDDLMQTFSISRGTVRKAIDLLERQYPAADCIFQIHPHPLFAH